MTLKSGGPPMTVTGSHVDVGCYVAWFINGEMRTSCVFIDNAAPPPTAA